MWVPSPRIGKSSCTISVLCFVYICGIIQKGMESIFLWSVNNCFYLLQKLNGVALSVLCFVYRPGTAWVPNL